MSYLITTEQYIALKSTIEALLTPFDYVAFSDFITTSVEIPVVIKKADQLVTTTGFSIDINYLQQPGAGYVVDAYYDITDNQHIIAINSDAQTINLLKNPSFTRTCSICNTSTNRSQGIIFSHPRQGDFCAHLKCVKQRLPELYPFSKYLQQLPALQTRLTQLQHSVVSQDYAQGIPLRLYLAIVEQEIRQQGFISKQDAIQYHHDFNMATYKQAENSYTSKNYNKSLSFEFVEKALLYTKQLKSTSFNDKLKSLCEQPALAPKDLPTAALIMSNYIVNNQGLISHQSPLATHKNLTLQDDGSTISESVRLKGKLGDFVCCHITINSCKFQSITSRYDIRGKDDLGRVVQFNSTNAVTEKSYIYLKGFISKFYQNKYGYTVTVLKGCKWQS